MIGRLRGRLVTAINQRIFYGWAIVGVGSLGIFTSGPGQSHTFSVFVEPIKRDLGISNADMALAYGIATLVAALVLPQMGRAIDRFGPARALGGIVACLGLACLCFGAAANFLWLAVGFGLLRFLGQGSLMLGCANMVSQWFSRGRGFAMSLMALGFGLSLAIHPPLAQALLDEVGWRLAWVVLGLITWLTMLPAILLLAQDKPEDVGLRPDGEGTAIEDATAGDGPVELGGLTLREALGTTCFYILSFGWFAIAMLVTTLHFYQVTLLTAQGVSVEFAAQVFTVSAITMVVAMPLVGRLFDRLRTRFVVALALLITALSLVGITFAQDTATSIVYALLFGLNNAFSMTMFGFIWPRYFGRRHLGSIQGTGQMIGVVGASLGTLPVGLALDHIGDATWTLRLLALYPLVAAAITVARLRTHGSIREFDHLE